MPMMLETGADGTAQFVTPTCNRPVRLPFPGPLAQDRRRGELEYGAAPLITSRDHNERPSSCTCFDGLVHKCDDTPRTSAAHRARFPTRAESEPRTLTVCCVLSALPLETVSDAGPRHRALSPPGDR